MRWKSSQVTRNERPFNRRMSRDDICKSPPGIIKMSSLITAARSSSKKLKRVPVNRRGDAILVLLPASWSIYRCQGFTVIRDQPNSPVKLLLATKPLADFHQIDRSTHFMETMRSFARSLIRSKYNWIPPFRD